MTRRMHRQANDILQNTINAQVYQPCDVQPGMAECTISLYMQVATAIVARQV